MATLLLANYSYLCQPVDYSWSKLGMRVRKAMGKLTWKCYQSLHSGCSQASG